MTPTSVGLVLVEGLEADGATMDGDAFDVRDDAIQTSEQATASVLRTEALAATHGRRLHSIGVTWSEDADAEASLLMRSLSESGFDNVVAIRIPEATEALARGIAAAIGYDTTAVCVIEPDTVIALIVHHRDGAVHTVFNHAVDSDESLISWLSTVFAKADWQPEALVVVGSAGGFDSIQPQLEDALSVPVFAPEEARLALARGAALASAHGGELALRLDDEVGAFAEAVDLDGGHHGAPAGRRLAPVGAATMLVAGVLTFVVSVSLAISLQLSPHQDSEAAKPLPAADMVPAPAVAPKLPPPASVPPAPAAPPAPQAPPVDIGLPDAAPPEAPIIDQVPVAGPQDPAVAPPPAPVAPPPAAVAPPPAAPPYVAPTKKPGILSRIRDKLRIGNDNPPPPRVAPPVPPVYPAVPGQ